MNTPFDIIIVGANMVGATLACALADSGLKLLLIDAQPAAPAWPEGSYDVRVSALTTTSSQILSRLGVWPTLVKERSSPFRTLRVWNEDAAAKLVFDSADIGLPYLGHIVENRRIQQALLQALSYRRNIEVRLGCALETLEVGHNHSIVGTSDQQTQSARLVVGADGRQSKVRQLARIATTAWSYQQHAIVAHVRTELPHQQSAWQRFLSSGPLAFLPLDDGRSSIVWSVDDSDAERLMAMDKDAFESALSQALQYALGHVSLDSERLSFPLMAQYAHHYVAPRIALVGDAAHGIHPLAGQGVNLGLLDAACLAEVIEQLQRSERDIGSEQSLRKYQRWRKGSNLAMLAATDGLNKLFSNNHSAIHWLRNKGLALTQAVPGLTPWFMQFAAGKDADLPTLARSQ